MRAALVTFFVIIAFGKSLANKTESMTISCLDLQSIPFVGTVITCTSTTHASDLLVKFYLSTNKIRTPKEFGPCDLSKLQNYFDPLEETIIIIHGYLANVKRDWIWDLKDRILDAKKGNVIMVDWSKLSTRKNYVNAARNTVTATQQIFGFLQAIRSESKNFKFSVKKKKWNQIYFIGHSLGAQVSGQTAYLLKQDPFWHVNRITGLDPAKPCFTDVDPKLRVDKQDADFVDIIHTQVGYGGNTDAFGLTQSIGHVDFYVNGGIVQSPCLGTVFTSEWSIMICSHRIAYKFFAESLLNSISGECKFLSYEWDGTYDDAVKSLNRKRTGSYCLDCPEMGIDTPKSTKRGDFLIITSTDVPYCEFKEKDTKTVLKVLRRLKFKKPLSITTLMPNTTTIQP
ncbi:PREDICTED: pancreatic lipase-related protein 2-like [Ceratosolen solmsi marchali]|uniref:phospholipase A1 n=1 Tax=Ceratosolen solmsi marchali TaxID=326594 RepID=A0AAJ6VL08_9HYME|nr:PREDICTED: pancreatic lipase-related protein 2-like [Ceratosolen solmsi marchali]